MNHPALSALRGGDTEGIVMPSDAELREMLGQALTRIEVLEKALKQVSAIRPTNWDDDDDDRIIKVN